MLIAGLAVFCVLTYTSRFHCDDHNHNKITLEKENKKTDKHVHFLWFSDIHLDLYFKSSASPDWSKSYCRNASVPAGYDAPFGRIGCDSPQTLLRNALYAMRNTAVGKLKPKFIVFTGEEQKIFCYFASLSFRESFVFFLFVLFICLCFFAVLLDVSVDGYSFQ